MNYSDSLTAIIFFSLLTTASVLLGRYMAAVFSGERTFMTPLMRPIEKIIYRICRMSGVMKVRSPLKTAA
ncbi:MAG TPA: potassium-transporting ATPase subunit KdpA, partial [Spirochaetota bacterium]|nr:potassium-transporting ATPase subunit KdpA [Spirochaetota bacterium]